MTTKESIHIKIIRLFLGEATPDEKVFIGNWLSQSPTNRKLHNDLKEIWLTAGVQNNTDQFNLEGTLQKLTSKLEREKNISKRKKVIGQFLKYAAVVVLVLAIPTAFYLGNRNETVRDSYTTITCALGDKTNMLLPDSSEVWLNSGSKLVFNNNFKNGQREVFLEGEAFFSVKNDAENPFRINTKEIEVEVLGTEFNLKAYADENVVTTTLVEGSVKVTSASQQTVIKPRQKLVYSGETKRMALYELTDLLPETEWKDGRLVFRNESLGDLELKLERWFDVDIVLADEAVRTRKYTGTLQRESILEVLNYFSLARSVNYKLEGNKITFYTIKKK